MRIVTLREGLEECGVGIKVAAGAKFLRSARARGDILVDQLAISALLENELERGIGWVKDRG